MNMVNIARTHTRRNSIGGSLSPKASELGEVDTKAPFQSVKDALSLFGVPSSSPPHVKTVFNKKSKPQPQPQPQVIYHLLGFNVLSYEKLDINLFVWIDRKFQTMRHSFTWP